MIIGYILYASKAMGDRKKNIFNFPGKIIFLKTILLNNIILENEFQCEFFVFK